MNTHPATDHRLPFGKHKGKPLGEVPSDYLDWLLRSCKLSSGLRVAVVEELIRRGIGAPSPAPPRPIAPCRFCGAAGYLCFWMEDRLGRKRIRAECRHCRRLLDHPPCVPPYSTMADAAACPTPILDALTQLDDLGIELASDGKAVWLTGDDWRRVPPDLCATIRQCSHQLARMIGNTERY